MAPYLEIITAWKSKFSHCNFIQVQRSGTGKTLASVVNFQSRHMIHVKYIPKSSIHKSDEKVLRLDTSPGWRNPIIAYLKDGTLLRDKAEAQKLQHLTTRYILLGDLLYKNLIPNCTLTHT